MNIGLPDTTRQKHQNLKNARWQTAVILKIEEVQYIGNVLTNFAKIWYDDASRPSERHHFRI